MNPSPSKAEEDNKLNKGVTRGKKRKKTMRDENAPKRPVNAYVMFMNERREALSKKFQDLSFAEITKLVGEEWSSLDNLKKKNYWDRAEKEKERYLKELKEYKQTEAFQSFLNKSKEVKETPTSSKNENIGAAAPSTGQRAETKSGDGSDIPIFTEAFLDYNKTKESELHQLIKANTAYEKQNILLEKHVDNLKNAVAKLNAETEQQNQTNNEIESKLNSFRNLLLDAFRDIRLPTSNVYPTIDNIDSYMAETCAALQDNVGNKKFVSAIQNVMGKVNFQTADETWNDEDDKK